MFLFVTTIILFGCKTEKDPVPNVSFSITIDTALPNYMKDIFYIPVSYQSGNPGDFGRAGVLGLIVLRIGSDFIAYDRYCPYDNSTRCAAILDESQFYGICSCCESEFILNTFEPYPSRARAINGPATDGPGLKSYRTQTIGTRLRIYN
jgi:hypothetical protein